MVEPKYDLEVVLVLGPGEGLGRFRLGSFVFFLLALVDNEGLDNLLLLAGHVVQDDDPANVELLHALVLVVFHADHFELGLDDAGGVGQQLRGGLLLLLLLLLLVVLVLLFLLLLLLGRLLFLLLVGDGEDAGGHLLLVLLLL